MKCLSIQFTIRISNERIKDLCEKIKPNEKISIGDQISVDYQIGAMDETKFNMLEFVVPIFNSGNFIFSPKFVCRDEPIKEGYVSHLL